MPESFIALLLGILLVVAVALLVSILLAAIEEDAAKKKQGDQTGADKTARQDVMIVSNPEGHTQASRNTQLSSVGGGYAVTTALERAGTIRNPLSAMFNSIATESQIEALQNAQKLADATARTANAEVKGIEAMMLRADRLSEMHIRRELEQSVRDDRIEETRERLTSSAHGRAIAGERRNKEQIQAQRETLDAKHSLEATKKFKPARFALGQARVESRIADAALEKKITETAVPGPDHKSGGARTATGGGDIAVIASLIEKNLNEIAEGEADGTDTGRLREQVAALKAVIARA